MQRNESLAWSGLGGRLGKVIDWLLDLPLELQQAFDEDIHQWEEENRMPYITSFERSGMAKGLREGIAAALEAKFGKADKRLMNRVHQIHDLDELRALLKASVAAETLQETRDRLPTRQG